MTVSCPAAIRSTPMATAASASPRCRIAARSWRCRPASRPGPVARAERARRLVRSRRSSPRATRSTFSSSAPDATSPSCRRSCAGVSARRGIGLDVMQTGAAARTYNVLLAENRKVGAALIAVDVSVPADPAFAVRALRDRSCGRRSRPLLGDALRACRRSGRPSSRSMPSTSRSRACAMRCARASPARSACNGGATRCRARRAATCAPIPSPPRSTTTIVRSACRGKPFVDLVDARVFDLYDDPMPSLNDLEGYCGETSSSL